MWSLHGYHECLTRLGRDDEAAAVAEQLALATARADVPIVASCACRTTNTHRRGCCGSGCDSSVPGCQQRPLSSVNVNDVWDRVRDYVRSAPLTYAWLAALLATTLVQHQLAPRTLRTLLQSTSTNIHHLASDPLRVLFQSLLWIDGRYWWPYLLIFTVFLAPAERWLGHLRWAVVGLICHVGATYLSEGYLYWTIHAERGVVAADRRPRRRRQLLRRRHRRGAVLPGAPAMALGISRRDVRTRRRRAAVPDQLHLAWASLRTADRRWPATR